jgi:hypothetical protein
VIVLEQCFPAIVFMRLLCTRAELWVSLSDFEFAFGLSYVACLAGEDFREAGYYTATTLLLLGKQPCPVVV